MLDDYFEWQAFINGALASMAAESVTFPLDLAKTRLQIQGQALESKYTKLRYRGPAHAVVKIFRQEGGLALYRGLKPAIFRQITYGGLKRFLYETMQKRHKGDPSFGANFVFALTAGSASAMVCNPVDIIKVRMQTQGTRLSACVRQLVYCERWKGLKRGLVPNVLRTGILVGTTFSVYDEVKRLTILCGAEEGFVSYTISSACASFVGTVVVNPFEVIKSRMMNQSERSVHYKNILHCFRDTYRSEGVRAFWKGCLTVLCRTVPWHIVFFLTLEHL